MKAPAEAHVTPAVELSLCTISSAVAERKGKAGTGMDQLRRHRQKAQAGDRCICKLCVLQPEPYCALTAFCSRSLLRLQSQSDTNIGMHTSNEAVLWHVCNCSTNAVCVQ